MRRSLALAGMLLALTACATPGTGIRTTTGEARAAAWFDAHRERPPMLRMFLQRMPKGGDIHTHLGGAVYAEGFIEWAAAATPPLCADPKTGAISTCCRPECGTRPVADALRDPSFYSAIVDGVSTRNLANQPQSGHDQFFGAFKRFSAATPDARWPDMVAEVTTRAADQRVGYLEIMLTVQGDEVRALAQPVRFDAGDLAGSRQRLLEAGLGGLVKQGIGELDAVEHGVARILGCERASPPPSCRVTRRYLQQSTRILEPNLVFAQLLYAFELARAERRVVGLNLVAPEDFYVARRDYSLQMTMIGWLGDQYPGVNVALHAGELSFGLVPPADLGFHIREAVEVARARRIGHGVDIAYERDARQLLETMRQRDVLVEICLTSNDVILGVKGPQHPFPDYVSAGVPVTLATDDEGVSRIDLTNEYVRAAQTYRLGYPDLKQLARNSLTYSFLPGASLWKTRTNLEPVEACAAEPAGGTASPACRVFLEASEKAWMQWELERAFADFETMGWAR